LNFTEAPVRPVPVIVTEVPTIPLEGLTAETAGAPTTVKEVALTAVPPGVVTLITPLSAPAGTLAVICVSVFVRMIAGTPPKEIAVAPVSAVPEIVTSPPMGPEVGRNEVTAGVGTTVKLLALEAEPPGVTILISPVVAPTGTVVVIVDPSLLRIIAATPLNVREVAPLRFEPLTLTELPTPPESGEKLEIEGGRTAAGVALAHVVPTLIPSTITVGAFASVP
jgi:hypothetical protein